MIEAAYDVVVLGAGPAGLAAAVSVRRRVGAASVLVVDAQTLGDQRIGECCPPDTGLLLQQLGVLDEFRHGDHENCPGYASVWGGPNVGYNDFIVNPFGQGWRLNRATFDRMLSEHAQRSGVQLAWSTRLLAVDAADSPGAPYTLHLRHGAERTSTVVKAGFIIDATGQKAVFARALGVSKRVDDELFALVRFARVVNGRGSAQVLLEATPEGWWYHCQLPERRAVTMIVAGREYLTKLRQDGFSGFDSALAGTTLVGPSAGRLSLDGVEYHSRAIRSGMLSVVEGTNWMAVGDAALTFDPVVAQGIHKGLSHGVRAANKVAGWFEQRSDDADAFSAHVRRQYADYLRAREHVYALERRWTAAPFWRLRTASKATLAVNDADK